MGKFIAKRLAFSAVIFFFVTFIIYALECNLPTSYVEQTARELATRPGATKSAQEWIDELNAQYGMDRVSYRGTLSGLAMPYRVTLVTVGARRCLFLNFLTSVSGTVS